MNGRRTKGLAVGALVLTGTLISRVSAAQPPAVPSETPPPAAPGAAAAELTLSAAIDEALRRRPLLAADAERVGAAEARVDQARAALRPRLDFQANASYGLPGAPQVFIGGLAGTPFKQYVGASVTLVQTLLDFGRARAAVRARRADVAASQAALQADRNRVALEVQQAYLQALAARRLLDVNRQIVEQRRLVARQAETLRETGLATRLDVDLAEVAVSQAELVVVRSVNEVENAYAALTTALGRPVSPATGLADVLTAEPSSEAAAAAPDLESAVATALRERPELRQVEAQVRAAEGQVSVARAARRPLLNFLGSVGKVNPGPLIEDSDEPYAVSLVLTAPLFTGGLLEAQVEEARRNRAAVAAGQEELANTVRQQVVQARAVQSAAAESVRVAEAQLTRAQDALNLATERYRSQFGTIVELTQAQVAFATAQNDLIRARYDQQLARAALEFATGRAYGEPAPAPTK